MRNRAFVWLMLIAGMNLLAGCSTTPRRERPPVAEPVVEAPAPGPSAEEERLRRQLEEEQAARARAEADRKALENQLNDALASQRPAPKKASQDSYLK